MDPRQKFVFLAALVFVLTIAGAGFVPANFASELVVEPQTAVPNQRVSLTGQGFSSIAVSGGKGPSGVHQITGVGESVITVGGTPLTPPYAFYPVNFDDFGNWAATVSIPVTDVTVAGGAITIKAVDDQGVTQTVQVIIGIPSITLDPETSRVNTDVSITGTGFPASNVLTKANGQVPISYAGFPLTIVSADDTGGFTATIRVPSETKIPSNNIVRATVLGFEQWGLAVHSVPEPTIFISPTSGVPGTAVTVTGKGFAPNALVAAGRAGNTNVLSSPVPATNDGGGFLTFFTMPIFSPGPQTVAFAAEGRSGAAVFTVSEGDPVVQPLPTPPPPSTLPADALTSLTQGENLLRVWTFDNGSKTWEFFDPRPAFVNANTIKSMVSGRIYWFQLNRDQSASLNGKGVLLFEGWNLVPW